MDCTNKNKFILPAPVFDNVTTDKVSTKLHHLTPAGMTLLPRENQPPPMYGKRGATFPAKFLHPYNNKFRSQNTQMQLPLQPPTTLERLFCEACDMSFQSDDDLKRHFYLHDCCPVDGCNYKCHPSVMDRHVMTLHSTGLFDKMKKLSTPEEIAAWREERRKRYPTLVNVQMRQRAKEQRQRRGERLEENKNRFGNLEDRRRAKQTQDLPTVRKSIANIDSSANIKNRRKENRARRRKNKTMIERKSEKDIGNEATKEEGATNERIICGMFRGTSGMEKYKHLKEKLETKSNVLYKLVGMYGSDDDDDDNEEQIDEHTLIPETILNVTDKQCENENNKTVDKSINSSQDEQIKNGVAADNDLRRDIEGNVMSVDIALNENESEEKHISRTRIENSKEGNLEEANISNTQLNSSDEAPEEVPIDHVIPDFTLDKIDNNECASLLITNKQTNRHKFQMKRKSGLDYRKLRLRKQNTLLEKLLEKDIRHERNVLLQCVRFICENNFFGIGMKNISENEKSYILYFISFYCCLRFFIGPDSITSSFVMLLL